MAAPGSKPLATITAFSAPHGIWWNTVHAFSRICAPAATKKWEAGAPEGFFVQPPKRRLARPAAMETSRGPGAADQLDTHPEAALHGDWVAPDHAFVLGGGPVPNSHHSDAPASKCPEAMSIRLLRILGRVDLLVENWGEAAPLMCVERLAILLRLRTTTVLSARAIAKAVNGCSLAFAFLPATRRAFHPGEGVDGLAGDDTTHRQ